jgi:hypothetical protein
MMHKAAMIARLSSTSFARPEAVDHSCHGYRYKRLFAHSWDELDDSLNIAVYLAEYTQGFCAVCTKL